MGMFRQVSKQTATCARLSRALLLAAITSILSDRYHQFSIAASAHALAPAANFAQSSSSQMMMTPNALSWATSEPAAAAGGAIDIESNVIGAPHQEKYDHWQAESKKSTPHMTIRARLPFKTSFTQQSRNKHNDSAKETFAEQQHLMEAAKQVETKHKHKQHQQQQQVEQDGKPYERQNCFQVIEQLRERFVEQVIRQRMADKDHLLMEKWLVDNINDLHRELKQTEMDFEHYVQVTKRMLFENNEQSELKRQLAAQTSLALSVPLTPTKTRPNVASPVSTQDGFRLQRARPKTHVEQQQSSSSSSSSSMQPFGLVDAAAYRSHQYHLTKMLLLGDNEANSR